MIKENNTNYQGQKNHSGNDGTTLKCFNCQSEYHFTQNFDKKKKEQEDNKEQEVMLTKVVLTKAIKDALKQEDKTEKINS